MTNGKCGKNLSWRLDDAENVAYMNRLADGYGFDKSFTACMIFYTDFKSPTDPHDEKITAWNLRQSLQKLFVVLRALRRQMNSHDQRLKFFVSA